MLMCCGEALIDMLPCNTQAGETSFVPHSGGAVFNTSIALGRLGIPVSLISGISKDLFGDILCASLDESGVRRDCAIYSDRPTTLAFVRLDDGQASYVFYDENSAGRMLTPDDILPIRNEAKAMFFGGISLATEPCGSFYEALMMREAAKRVIMVDPNIRPAFISDEPAYRARLKRMFAQADIVKLSDEDLEWITGEQEIASGADTLLHDGVPIVFVTQGAKGAHAFTRQHRVFVPARKVAVVDTVGAGDTFNAGLLAAFWRAGALAKSSILDADRSLLETALDLGVRTAAITVSRAGASPPWAKEI